MKNSFHQERRAGQRIAVHLNVMVSYRRNGQMKRTEATMLDLSLSGAMLRVLDEVQTGDEITLEFKFSETHFLSARIETERPDTGEAEFNSSSIVRWSKETEGHLVGIEFTKLAASDRDVLKRVFLYFFQLLQAGVSFSD